MELPDKMIDVFEMLIERLTNIEIQNNKMMNHLKEKCMKDGILEKNLFGYPLDVKLIDGTQFHGKKCEYVLVSFPNQSYDKEALYLRLDNAAYFQKVKPLIEKILSQEQLSRVLEYIEYLKTIPDNEDVKALTCEELGINSIYNNFTEHILNLYFQDKNPKIRFIVNSINEFPTLILKNVEDVDEIWVIVKNVLDFWDFSMKQRYTDDCMHVKEFSNDWVWFYILLVGEIFVREEHYDINWKNLYSKVSVKQFEHYTFHLKRIRNGLIKTNNCFLNEDVLDDIEKRLKEMEKHVRK
jgi:hypothetical protein